MLRDYQQDAVDIALQKRRGLLVLPTGSGKSHIIAGIVNGLTGNVVILQPTKEILESNYQKIQQSGFRGATIFSASCDSKVIGKATYGTIGSVIKHIERFQPLEAIIVDEAHLTNARGGQYDEFIKAHDPPVLIGLTATPYRLYSNREWGSQVKMLHRTRPKIFDKILHVTQCSDLAETGYLHKPTYIVSDPGNKSILQSNAVGSEYTDDSMQLYLSSIDAPSLILSATQDALSRGAKHILVFTPSLAESDQAVDAMRAADIKADSVCGTTPKRERELRLAKFRCGMTTAIVNVGVLCCGYDFPELDCIISARPTMSLALYYQIIGRGVRPHPLKAKLLVYDLIDNYSKFGDPIDMRIVADGSGQYDVLASTGRLTTRDILADHEMNELIKFGEYRDKPLHSIRDGYLKWYCKNGKMGPVWHMFSFEMIRREIWESVDKGD